MSSRHIGMSHYEGDRQNRRRDTRTGEARENKRRGQRRRLLRWRGRRLWASLAHATAADFGSGNDDSGDGGDRGWVGFAPAMAATAWGGPPCMTALVFSSSTGVEPMEGRQWAGAGHSSMEPHFPMAEVLKCIKIGLICVQQRPEDRPMMASVVLILGSDTASVAMRGHFKGFLSSSKGDSCTVYSYDI
ncbi:hypothetical protein Taro_043509 [Colocasia esculenta]|uniref:S-locus receptor kinase C-terminal domain-containing protein n=1 Tax=Colocasia esculenta TaxID=4460 RepID=A0A843WRM0_COLES|nr:hypothetical protein [Colocasia esculenta]